MHYILMKTSHHLLLCLINLLSISTIHLQPCMAAEQPSPVLDVDGNIVRAGVDYYVLPVVPGQGGGLTLSSNKTCPIGVVQGRLEAEHGLPLTFHPVNPKKGIVRLSMDLNVKFSGATTACARSTVWVLEHDETSGRNVIRTGGVEGNPGGETVSNWFKIDQFEGQYKLFFCPTVCRFCKVICKDVGVLVQDGNRVLSLTNDEPFKVMFKKASS